MPTRLAKKFTELKKERRQAFTPFITAGYPDLATTEALIHTLEKAGASIIELGIPFSDPMADGPTIQKANEHALKKGTNLKKVLDLVTKVRKKSEVPLLLMGYFNPIYQYGLKKFCHDCETSGVDALLIVDLPPEEAGPLRAELKGKPIDLIHLLAPTSDTERIRLVKQHGSGFVYFVSMTGITGAASVNPKEVSKHIKRIRKEIKLPIQIGFGISKPKHVRQLSGVADGLVVGSSLIQIINQSKTKKEALQKVSAYTKQMIKAF